MAEHAALSTASFSTGDVPAARRLESWERHNAEQLVALRCQVPGGVGDFGAEETVVTLGGMRVARVRAARHRIERPADLVERSPQGSVALYAVTGGGVDMTQDGARISAGPGRLIVSDPDVPFARTFTQGVEEFVVTLPAHSLDLSAGPFVVGLDSPVGRALARHLATIVSAVDGQALGEEDTEAALRDLARTLVAQPVDDPARVHRLVAEAVIDECLDDVRLSAGQIAAAVGISDRHLSRVFAEGGTSVPQAIVARRLERARALLATSDASVHDVAARCGFGSRSHFSRVFRERYGVAPGAYRAAVQPSASGVCSFPPSSKRVL